MDAKFTPHLIAVVLLVLLAGIFFSLGERQIIVSDNSMSKISVSGYAKKEVMPNEATLRLSVITQGDDPKKVQEQNSVQMNKVMDALQNEGIDKKNIETVQYYLYPKREYDYQNQKWVDFGYELQHTINVKTNEIDKAGTLVDLAVKNGINNVDNIFFSLSDEKENEIKEQLTAEASKNAKEKAERLAKNLDVSLGKAVMISESSYIPGVYYAALKGASAAEVAAQTVINPKNVEVSLTVNVDFKIE